MKRNTFMTMLLVCLLMLAVSPVRVSAVTAAPDPAVPVSEDQDNAKWDAEKEKMLEALDTMREMGFSTTGILETAGVAYDKYAREQVEETTQRLKEEAQEKTEDVTRQVTEKVEEKAEEAAENMFEAFWHRLQKALEDLISAGDK